MRVHLEDRGVVRVAGEDAVPWLQNIVTCDIARLEPAGSRWGALLTPQGKILFDFIVTRMAGEAGAAGALLLDVPLASAADLARRLRFYRLRAKVVVEDLSAGDVPAAEGERARMAVVATREGEVVLEPDAVRYPDPRSSGLGWRAVMAADEAVRLGAGTLAEYHARRIGLGVPEGGLDFAYGDTFPHEALMDLLGGVDFRKGCYVGQEVVSRMEHRGTARTRVLPVVMDGPAPALGTEVVAGGKALGRMGSSAGRRGLALMRLDRVEDALAAGQPLVAGDAVLTLAPRPGWWTAPWPGEPAVSGA